DRGDRCGNFTRAGTTGVSEVGQWQQAADGSTAGLSTNALPERTETHFV
ncbi:hypothetical protein AVDCRST_MAG94-5226, partial [uncultured Leptolyngbya sp.]